MNTDSNFSASCRDQKQPTLDDIIEIDGFNDMSLSERIAAMDKATVSAPLHVEATFTPPNVSFKEDLRPLRNDNLKEIIDAARKALDDAFEADRTCSQIEDHLFDAKEARAKWQRYAGAKLLVVKRRVKEDGGHWGDFIAEHFPRYSIRTVQWHIKRFLDETTDEDALDYLDPPKPQSVAKDYGREDWVMTDDGEAEADPMILEDTLEDQPDVAPVVLAGIAEAPELRRNSDCVEPAPTIPPSRQPEAMKAASQDRRNTASEKRTANGGKPAQQRLYGEHKALFDEWVRLGREMTEAQLCEQLDQLHAVLAQQHQRSDCGRPQA